MLAPTGQPRLAWKAGSVLKKFAITVGMAVGQTGVAATSGVTVGIPGSGVNVPPAGGVMKNVGDGATTVGRTVAASAVSASTPKPALGGVLVGRRVAVLVGVSVMVVLGVTVNVSVGLALGLGVTVKVGVAVALEVGLAALVAVGVSLGVKDGSTASVGSSAVSWGGVAQAVITNNSAKAISVTRIHTSFSTNIHLR